MKMAGKGKEVNIRKYTLAKVHNILMTICYLFHNLDRVFVKYSQQFQRRNIHVYKSSICYIFNHFSIHLQNLICQCFSVEFLIVSSVLPSLDPVIPSRWAAGFLSQWDESSEFYKYLTAVLVEAPTTAVTLCWDLDPWFKKKKKKHRKVEVMLFRELREAYTHNLK